jgi:hypothetical protein
LWTLITSGLSPTISLFATRGSKTRQKSLGNGAEQRLVGSGHRELIFGGPHYLGIVISVAGESFREGFSVEDSEAALKVLESLLPRTGRQ